MGIVPNGTLLWLALKMPWCLLYMLVHESDLQNEVKQYHYTINKQN
jgi:hypothetical protein